jgi:endonuclease/exonuclease/phosphatase family metal-dependent hydrolase
MAHVRLYALLLSLCLLQGVVRAQSVHREQLLVESSSSKISTALNEESDLLESGSYAPGATRLPVPTDIKVVSYNIRWRGGEDLRRLIQLLKSDSEIGGAAIIGLQEVDRRRKRTGHVNTARLIAEQLSLNYAWAAPPTPPKKTKSKDQVEEETGVAIFSPYPISDVERIVLPNPGPGGRRRAAIGATVHIGGHGVRVYSVHAETRVPMKKKMEQLEAVIDASTQQGRPDKTVVMGDFNTIKGKDVKACIKLFENRGFTTPVPHNRSTWKTFIIKLKLDWLWLRGLEPSGHNIVHRIGFSDHWPLWVSAKL